MNFGRIKEAAEFYRCSPSTVRRLRKDKLINWKHHGNYYEYELTDLRAKVKAEKQKTIEENKQFVRHGLILARNSHYGKFMENAVQTVLVDDLDDQPRDTDKAKLLYDRLGEIIDNAGNQPCVITQRVKLQETTNPGPDKQVASLLTYAAIFSGIISCFLYF